MFTTYGICNAVGGVLSLSLSFFPFMSATVGLSAFSILSARLAEPANGQRLTSSEKSHAPPHTHTHLAKNVFFMIDRPSVRPMPSMYIVHCTINILQCMPEVMAAAPAALQAQEVINSFRYKIVFRWAAGGVCVLQARRS